MSANSKSNIIKKIYQHFTLNLNIRRAIAVVLGCTISGFGIAVLKLSFMGNDPYSAMNMAISDGLHMGLGTYQLIVNVIMLVIQLLFGRKYIGFGTIINMCFLGYIVQYSGVLLSFIFGTFENQPFYIYLIVMLISVVIVSAGLSMYQTADLGVAPFDFLSLGLDEHVKLPYFFCRMITDVGCVVVILIAFAGGLFPWADSHIGIGTVVCAFGLGPVVNAFTKLNRKWIMR